MVLLNIGQSIVKVFIRKNAAFNVIIIHDCPLKAFLELNRAASSMLRVCKSDWLKPAP